MDYPVYHDKRSRSMATAAMVLGIVGISTGCCVYTAIICGALAIMLALLSRGGEMTMSVNAKVGLGLGIAGVATGILMITLSFAYVIQEFGSFENYMEYYFQLMENLYR